MCECVCGCVPGQSLHTLAAGFLPAPGTVAAKKSQVADDAMRLAIKSLIITSNNLHKTACLHKYALYLYQHITFC